MTITLNDEIDASHSNSNVISAADSPGEVSDQFECLMDRNMGNKQLLDELVDVARVSNGAKSP